MLAQPKLEPENHRLAEESALHILRKMAVATPARDDPPAPPRNSTYDVALGVWTGPRGALTYDDNFAQTSKKMDVETGEDQKGL